MAIPTSRLSFSLLGSPEIRFSGEPLALPHLKARALLFYLAAGGEAYSRDNLATLLWSESSQGEAHHSLRSSLYRLRQALPSGRTDPLLVAEGDRLGLRPSAYTCDVLEFRRLLAEGDEASLARATALYRGPLLQGFTLADAPLFDAWERDEEARLSQACFRALDRLASLAEARSDPAAAVRALQQMVRLDPLDESACQRLMHLYLQSGEIGLALGQYRRLESALQRELDLEPSSETRDLLYDALRRQRLSVALPSTPLAAAPGPLPFVGREALLDRLAAIAREAGAGSGATLLIEGEAGVGKTRLLNELVSRLLAGTPPWLVLQGACSPFDDLLSYGPFLEALQGEVAADLPVLPESPDPGSRAAFSWHFLQTVRSLAHGLPLLLAIEDLQWADSATLNLFGFLSVRLQGLPILLVGTVQHAGEVPALQRLVPLGRRRGTLHLVPLAPLPPESVADLLRRSGVLPSGLEALADWLHTRSAGSPFLLSEILAQLRREGLLHPQASGDWQLDTAGWLRWRASFSLPETTHDLVAWRLASLPPETRQLLDLLAVAGGPLSADALRLACGLPAEGFLELVDDLMTHGLAVETAGGQIDLSHHLLREALLHRLSGLRRRSLHRHLAQALESSGASLALALHAVAAEDVERARRYGLPVLSSLPQQTTGAGAIDFVQHLYDLLAPSAAPGEMIQLTRALGRLHQSLGHLEQAAGWHSQNLEWAQRSGDPSARAEARFEVGELALVRNDYAAAVNSAREGLAEIEAGKAVSDGEAGNPAALAGRGHRLLGAALAMEGSDLAAAEKHLQEAASALRRSGGQGDLCAALFELGNVAAQRGQLTSALELYDESARLAEAGHIYYYLALARNNFAYHSLLLGRVGAARQAVAEGIKVAETYDLLGALLHLYSTRGEIDLYLGEWHEAEASFREGLALAEELGSLERQAGYRGGLALVARGCGELGEAARLLQEALEMITDQGYWHLHTRLLLWMAETRIEGGNFSEAGIFLREALAVARSHARSLLLVQGERLEGRLLATEGDWQAAGRCFSEALEEAGRLGLELEAARTQAAWGKAESAFPDREEAGRVRLAAARSVLAAHDARADLAALR